MFICLFRLLTQETETPNGSFCSLSFNARPPTSLCRLKLRLPPPPTDGKKERERERIREKGEERFFAMASAAFTNPASLSLSKLNQNRCFQSSPSHLHHLHISASPAFTSLTAGIKANGMFLTRRHDRCDLSNRRRMFLVSSSGGGGSDGGNFSSRGGGGGGGDDHGNEGGSGNAGDKNKAEALLVLAEAGRSLECLPKDLVAAIEAGRIPGSVITKFFELEKSAIMRWLMQFGGFKERLLADDLFLAKVGMECGVGVFTKVFFSLTLMFRISKNALYNLYGSSRFFYCIDFVLRFYRQI